MPGPANDVVDIWERLLRFQRTALAEMDRNLRADFGLSLDAYDVMHQVGANAAAIRMGDLAERLLVANSSCTRLVGKLVDAGHLRRRTGGGDRREVLVELTPSGRRLLRRMAVRHTRDIQHLVGDDLGGAALRSLAAVLPRP